MDRRLEHLASVARYLKLKPTCPANFDAAKAVRGTKTRRVIEAVSVLGATMYFVSVWTVQYDKVSKCILEAKIERCLQSTRNGTPHELIYASPTVVLLTATGTNTWTKDATWNNAINTVECIGGGGNGGNSATQGGGGGAGGGAYAVLQNLTLSGNPSYTINAATDTNFNSGSVIAKAGSAGGAGSGGTGGSGGPGGAAASCTPSTGAHTGGAGQAGGSGLGNRAGGFGGGAAGTSDGSGQSAGAGSWTSSPGGVTITPGAGGAATGAGPANGNTGSLYGGAGSGAGTSGVAGGNRTGGAGRQGAIILTWTVAASGIVFTNLAMIGI